MLFQLLVCKYLLVLFLRPCETTTTRFPLRTSRSKFPKPSDYLLHKQPSLLSSLSVKSAIIFQISYNTNFQHEHITIPSSNPLAKLCPFSLK